LHSSNYRNKEDAQAIEHFNADFFFSLIKVTQIRGYSSYCSN